MPRNKAITIIIPCKNESGSLDYLFQCLNQLDPDFELILIVGISHDNTLDKCLEFKKIRPKNTIVVEQSGSGKMAAVREAALISKYDNVAIWDADFSVEVTDQLMLIRTFCESDQDSLITGSRLNLKMELGSMRFLNFFGNLTFALLYSLKLNMRISDTLCGSKIFPKKLLLNPLNQRFSRADPFGDHSLLLEASLAGMKINCIPVSYKKRRYGKTNIHRFRHGFSLLKLYFSL